MITKTYYLLMLALLAALQSFSQDTVRYRIQTDDGNVYYGMIMGQEPGAVELATESIGTIIIPFHTIIKMERVTGDTEEITREERKREGSLSPEDVLEIFPRPQETSYHFTPNGYGLKKGEGYYQNSYLFVNQFYAGVSDHFTLGGGLIPIPIEGGLTGWITPKISLPLLENKINLGIGSLNGIAMATEPEKFGVFYTTLTFGSRERNFSVGAGKGYLNGFDDGLAFSVSGAYKVGDRAYLINENYNYQGMLVGTVGGRYVWPMLSIEYSFIYVSEFSSFYAFPYVGIIVPLDLIQKND